MEEVLQRIIDLIGPKHGASKALADYLGIHPNVITNWKNGRNKSYRGYLKQIADYFGVSVDYLLGKEPKEKPATNEGDEPLEDCIVLHRDGKTSRYKFTREQLDAMAEMIKKFGEEKTDL